MTTAFITHPTCLQHEMGMQHPECPQRLSTIYHTLQASGVWDKLRHYTAKKVTHEQILRAHDTEYLNKLLLLNPKDDLIFLDPDTAMNPSTLEAAFYAAGSLITAGEIVMKGKVKQAFCCVRPPGHHAEKNQAMGFCFFNNIAIGALHTIKRFGVKKIVIIDFDVHHGNGTEDIFKDDERILFFSSFEHPLYPFNAKTSRHDNIIYFPQQAGQDASLLLTAMQQQWLPRIREFQPEIIFVSAGFDAHHADPLAHLQFTTEHYQQIMQLISDLANDCCAGKLVISLEGGYHLSALGESVNAILKTIGF
ncbi:MAG: histone deacetylase family protein [Legionellales bacterium]|nr:histone deacetylase family protein [Legionellales bacterium]